MMCERWKTTLTGRKSSERLRAAKGARSAAAPRLAGIWSIWPCGISRPVASQSCSQILGLDLPQCEGRRVVEVTRESDLLGVVKQVLAKRETVHSEVVMGTVRPRSFAITAGPVVGPDPGKGRPDTTGAVLVLHDISELRRLERVRRDFVANVSHELRTPLTAIQGFAETLLGGAIDDQENRGRFLEIIRDHARRLARLTADLLKLSEIEADRIELEL